MAEAYDASSAAMFRSEVVAPAVELLRDLAKGGAALEFAIGTGRIALPLAEGGISVSGIELSPHMAEQLRRKPGGDAIPVTVGDMTTAQVQGSFRWCISYGTRS